MRIHADPDPQPWVKVKGLYITSKIILLNPPPDQMSNRDLCLKHQLCLSWRSVLVRDVIFEPVTAYKEPSHFIFQLQAQNT